MRICRRRRRCCSPSVRWIQSNASSLSLALSVVVVVNLVVVSIVFFCTAVSGQFYLREGSPTDEASYSAQCRIAPTIALNEPVTITFTNGSIVWVYDPIANYSDSTQRHPQQGAVLMCSRESTYIYYDGIGTHKNQWYKILGNGRQVLTASTCGVTATSITVLQDRCPTLQCNLWMSEEECPSLCVDTAMATTVPPESSSSSSSLGSNTSSTTTNNCPYNDGTSTSLSWISEINRTYYIQVWQYYDAKGGSPSPYPDPFIQPCGGTTNLTVSESMIPTNYNSCPNAQSLSLPVVVVDDTDDDDTISTTRTNNSTTTNATLVAVTNNGNASSNSNIGTQQQQQHFKIVKECSPDDNGPKSGISLGDADGLWYTLLGNGNVWYIETCKKDIVLRMFTAGSSPTTCQQLSCFNDFVIVQNVVKPQPKCSRFTFRTTNATRYYIHAWGPGILNPTFRLEAHEKEEETKDITTTTTSATNNDRCVDANRFVADGIPKILSFENVVHSNPRPDKWYVDVATPTLWYTLNGTGNIFTVEICPPVVPNLFTGTCTNGVDRTNDLILQPPYDFDYTYNVDSCVTFRFPSNVSVQYLFGFRNILDRDTRYNVTLWEENARALPLYSVSCEYAIGPLSYNNTNNTASSMIGQFVDATVGGGGATLMKSIYFYTNPPNKGKFLRGRACRHTNNNNGDFDVVLRASALETCQSTLTFSTSEMDDLGKLVGPIDDNGCRTISWRRDPRNTRPLFVVVSSMDVTMMEIEITIWEESSSIQPLNDKPPVSYESRDTTLRNYPRISVGTTIVGSTTNAHADLPFCDSSDVVKVNQPDVWYIVQGDGRELQACLRGITSNNVNTNSSSSFSGAVAVVTKLKHSDSIYIGCIPNVEYGSTTNCPISVRWKTTNNTIYSLLVQTTEPNAFELSLWNVSSYVVSNIEWQCIAPANPPNNDFSVYSASTVVPVVSTPTTVISPASADPSDTSFSTPSKTNNKIAIASSSGDAMVHNCGGHFKLVVALAAALVHSAFIWM